MRTTLHFSGHETFALRYGWLKKVVDAFNEVEAEQAKTIFDPHKAIARFGVGKNMVVSMRHWGVSTGILDAMGGGLYSVNDLGHFLFDDNGFDPYLEKLETLWLIHWNLTKDITNKTTWYYLFNHFNAIVFDKDKIFYGLRKFVDQFGNRKITEKTLRSDIDCLINTYVPKRRKKGRVNEDTLESPLAELGIIQETSQKGIFGFRIGDKKSLTDRLLSYTVKDFMDKAVPEGTASIERLAYDPISPGKVFKLDEKTLSDRIERIQRSKSAPFDWTETAGLQRLAISNPNQESITYLKN